MYYFSELAGKKVYTDNNEHIGHLDDLLFIASATPKITKLVVHTRLRPKLTIPLSYLIRINNKIVIRSDYETIELEEDELYVNRNILDKQIIDLKGHKVVRVNDVIIQDKPYLYVAGVDTGLRGVMRWFGLESLVCTFYNLLRLFKINIEQNILSWGDIQPLELARGKVVLKKETEQLRHIRPEDLAYYLNKTNLQNVTKILRLLDDKLAATVISELNVNYQTDLIRYFSQEKAVKILSLIDPDEAVDILLSLSQRRRDLIVENFSEDVKKKIKYLLLLSKTPIGGLITSEYITVSPLDTAGKVIEKIKKETINYTFLNNIYVVNEQHQLVGVFNLHELLMQNPDTQVIKFMIPNVIVIRLTTPEEIAIDKMLKYKIQTLPVIDKNKQLLGLVTFDDIDQSILNKLAR